MLQSKGKHAGVRAGAISARRVTESVVSARGSTAKVPPSRREASRCEAALLRVLHGAGLLPQAAAGAVLKPVQGTARLLAALRELEPEMAAKIQALLLAGRDGQSVALAAVAPAPVSDGAQPFAAMTLDPAESGPRLVDYLRRGHAIACAMDIDVDGPLASWRSPPAPDLDERAWLSFGKQLAGSNPEDWQGLGVPEPSAQGFGKLYLKLGENAWWSFQALLDRPTSAGMAKERRALAKRRVKGVPVRTLDALVAQLGSAGGQGRALRRASRAIRARVGQLGPALAPRA